jgi:Rps23 Pro-64 3,4-dihydroxylase Tpa1-like proline 4-hydroxylase
MAASRVFRLLRLFLAQLMLSQSSKLGAAGIATSPELFTRTGVHHLTVADDFCSFAAELREELLRFGSWQEMRQQGDRAVAGIVNPQRQNGLTTGHITDEQSDCLPNCLLFRGHLQAALPALCAIMDVPFSENLQIEMNAMAYGEGAWLSPHTDRGKTAAADDRLIAWMLYLTDPHDGEWAVEQGGAARLWGRDGREVRLSPKFNRFAMFRVSNQSFHEIETIRRNGGWQSCRLALSGWIRAPYEKVENGVGVYVRSADYDRLKADRETALLGGIALYQLMEQQRRYCNLPTGKIRQVLREYQRDYEAHMKAPVGTSFSHRAPGPQGCIAVLNEDQKVIFFGPCEKYPRSPVGNEDSSQQLRTL